MDAAAVLVVDEVVRDIHVLAAEREEDARVGEVGERHRHIGAVQRRGLAGDEGEGVAAGRAGNRRDQIAALRADALDDGDDVHPDLRPLARHCREVGRRDGERIGVGVDGAGTVVDEGGAAAIAVADIALAAEDGIAGRSFRMQVAGTGAVVVEDVPVFHENIRAVAHADDAVEARAGEFALLDPDVGAIDQANAVPPRIVVGGIRERARVHRKLIIEGAARDVDVAHIVCVQQIRLLVLVVAVPDVFDIGFSDALADDRAIVGDGAHGLDAVDDGHLRPVVVARAKHDGPVADFAYRIQCLVEPGAVLGAGHIAGRGNEMLL